MFNLLFRLNATIATTSSTVTRCPPIGLFIGHIADRSLFYCLMPPASEELSDDTLFVRLSVGCVGVITVWSMWPPSCTLSDHDRYNIKTSGKGRKSHDSKSWPVQTECTIPLGTCEESEANELWMRECVMWRIYLPSGTYFIFFVC